MTTQFATASYQEIIDLHTETDKVSVLGLHTPVTRTPYDMLQGFFDMFQKYHYDGCSFALVPAARLPADPSQVSYGAGVPPIDPRDLLNPILWHGCHGESLGSVLNQFLSGRPSTSDIAARYTSSLDEFEPSVSQVGNDAIFEGLYYRALSDNTWLKAHPQKGLRRSGLRPLVYSLSTDRQYVPGPYGIYNPALPTASLTAQDPDDNAGLNLGTASGTLGVSTAAGSSAFNVGGSEGLQFSAGGSVSNGFGAASSQFFTSRLHGLGWLDTRVRTGTTVVTNGFTGVESNDSALLATHYANVEETQKVNYLPRLFMGVCLLPPAYKTEQYFRLIINHRFSFKKFRGISLRGDYSGGVSAGRVPNYSNFN